MRRLTTEATTLLQKVEYTTDGDGNLSEEEEQEEDGYATFLENDGFNKIVMGSCNMV